MVKDDQGAVVTGLLLNPRTYDPSDLDPEARRLLRATTEWFEARGKTELKRVHHEREWYGDFLDFMASEKAFATFLTPGSQGGRWDTARICAFGEVLAFYGLGYWYAWQVTILGLGPVWQSDNQEAKARAAQILQQGGVFAFGLSEKAHGADIYATDMVLTPDGDGFRANGSKYYIGNGNVAGMVSVFGRRADVEGPEGYLFFAADSRHRGPGHSATYPLGYVDVKEALVPAPGQGLSKRGLPLHLAVKR